MEGASFLISNSSFLILLFLSPPIHKSTDGYEKYEERDNISPNIRDTGGGADGVVTRNETFACEGIIDDAILKNACTWIHHFAGH